MCQLKLTQATYRMKEIKKDQRMSSQQNIVFGNQNAEEALLTESRLNSENFKKKERETKVLDKNQQRTRLLNNLRDN